MVSWVDKWWGYSLSGRKIPEYGTPDMQTREKEVILSPSSSSHLSSSVSVPSRSLAISCSFQFLRFTLLARSYPFLISTFGGPRTAVKTQTPALTYTLCGTAPLLRLELQSVFSATRGQSKRWRMREDSYHVRNVVGVHLVQILIVDVGIGKVEPVQRRLRVMLSTKL